MALRLSSLGQIWAIPASSYSLWGCQFNLPFLTLEIRVSLSCLAWGIFEIFLKQTSETVEPERQAGQKYAVTHTNSDTETEILRCQNQIFQCQCNACFTRTPHFPPHQRWWLEEYRSVVRHKLHLLPSTIMQIITSMGFRTPDLKMVNLPNSTRWIDLESRNAIISLK